jgi:hypothetical protein
LFHSRTQPKSFPSWPHSIQKGHVQMELKCRFIPAGTSSPFQHHHNLELLGVGRYIDAEPGSRPEWLRRCDSCCHEDAVGLSYQRVRLARNVDEPVNERATSNCLQCLLL